MNKTICTKSNKKTRKSKIDNVSLKKDVDSLDSEEEMTTETLDQEQLSLKDIRDTFYKCRDFEITNLWHKSVFLFGFILACFTGYGTILIALLTSGEQYISYPFFAHLVECAISMIGMVFSLIWVMMAKGSKAWYEIYEKAIGMIEGKDENSKTFLGLPSEYQMGKYCVQYEDNIEDSLFSLKGGRYSPSKLNVFIGYVLFGIWIICFICHFVFLSVKSIFCNFEMIKKMINYFYDNRYDFYPVIVLILAVAVFLMVLLISGNCKSGSIRIKYQ